MQVPPNPLIVALDLPDRASIVSLASQLAGEVGMVKVGYEAYLRYGGDLLSELADLGHRIFLDLKLHDIPRTVAAGVKSGATAELGLLTIHAAGALEMVAAAVEASDGLFDVVAVTLLTSLDEATVRSVGYQQSVPEQVKLMAELSVNAGAAGVVCSARELTTLQSVAGIRVVPGFDQEGAALGDQKRVATPAEAQRRRCNLARSGASNYPSRHSGRSRARDSFFTELARRPMMGRGRDTWTVGRKPVLELLESAMVSQVEEALISRRLKGGVRREMVELCTLNRIQLTEVDEERLSSLAGDTRHQGVALRLRKLEAKDWYDLLDELRASVEEELPSIVLLDQVQDPRNLGAIARSCAAFGVQAIVIPKDRSADIGPAALKTSAGALHRLPFARVTNLKRAMDDLQKIGFWSVGLALEGGEPISNLDLDRPIAWVVGSEGHGIRPGTAKSCDFIGYIPITAGVESLNASVAASIVLYERARFLSSQKQVD